MARLTAEPGVIPRGAAASLRWQVTGQTGDDASSVTIDQGIGAVRKASTPLGIPERVHDVYAEGHRPGRDGRGVGHRHG